MSYSTGMLKHRILVQNRKKAEQGKFGLDSAGIEWEDTVCLWAAVDFVKGVRAMREGALDVYGVVMVRTRWTNQINDRSRIVYEGHIFFSKHNSNSTCLAKISMSLPNERHFSIL